MIKSRIYDLAAMQVFGSFKSPFKEKSLWTRLSINKLEVVRDILRKHLPEQYTYRIRFQGPRFGLHKMSTNKADAVSFMVYVEDRKPGTQSVRNVAPVVATPPEFIWSNGYKYQLCVL
jgi:hypothetical protein